MTTLLSHKIHTNPTQILGVKTHPLHLGYERHGGHSIHNPAAFGEISYLRGDGVVENVTSDLFPASTGPVASGGGNASIETTLSLPQPCIAPIVFVTNPGGAWFAATGR